MIVSQPALGALRQVGWWALGRRRRFRVVGPSMEPTLHHGEFVLVDPAWPPVPGELALAQHPTDPDLLVVKRVAAITPERGWVLTSDNPEAGTDSRQWGPLAPGAVVGRVALILDRPGARLDQPSPPSGGQGTGPGRHRWPPLPALARWLRR
ncbi:MAG: nickel-type superoxide dismutase maturation protease [Acidimicrobiia bacterium]|nr:nickel-type superoxide dismutase maturation protease [Acidimicrobiia bacterium]MDH5289097.1 nickel-type superoxide dismutase maturation protease [Acidimicrobiia bacterium]